MLALIATYVVTVATDRRRIHRALDEATAGTHRAEQVTDFMLGLFDASAGGQSLGDTVEARALLERGLARAHELAGQPALQAQMLDVVGRLETQLGEYDRARPVLEEALALRRKLDGDNHPDVATSLEALAYVEYGQGNYAEAVKLRRDVLALRRRLLGDSDTKTTTALLELATAMHAQGDFRGAQPLLDEWVAIVSRQRPETTDVRAHELRISPRSIDYRGQAASRRASRSRRRADTYRALYGERHPEVCERARRARAPSLIANGKRDEADSVLRRSIDLLREVYPGGHPDLVSALQALGRRARPRSIGIVDARPPLRESIAMARRFEGPDSPRVIDAEVDLSIALTMTGTVRRGGRHWRAMQSEFFEEIPRDQSAGASRRRRARATRFAAPANSRRPSRCCCPRSRRSSSGRGFSQQPREYAIAALVRLYEAQGRHAEAAKYEALRHPMP